MEFGVKTLDVKIFPAIGLFKPLNFSGKGTAGDH